MKKVFLSIALVLLSLTSLQAQITLLKPAGGEVFRAGTSNDLKWDTTGTNGQWFVFQFGTSPSGPWTNLPLPNGLDHVLDSTVVPEIGRAHV